MPSLKAKMLALAIRINKDDKDKSLIAGEDTQSAEKQTLAVDLHHLSKLYYATSTPSLPSTPSGHPEAILTDPISVSTIPHPSDPPKPVLVTTSIAPTATTKRSSKTLSKSRPLITPRRHSSLLPVASVRFEDGNAELATALAVFSAANPQYRATSELDRVRRQYYRRLDEGGHVYLDYTGGSLYPSHLIDWHHSLLSSGIFGNPHSDSPASRLSTTHEESARRAVLDFLDADPSDYDVIFTPNATGGLKIVTENYPFSNKRLVVAMDAHNSVNGMACTARRAGGTVDMVELEEEHSTVDGSRMEELLRTSPDSHPGLVFFTGQSNVTGAKAKPWWFALARQYGWHTGLDASALAPTTPISLKQNPVDFLVISVYKIIGYPTGVGALVVRKEARRSLLIRHTFTGGTIAAVDPVDSKFRLHDSYSAFEDGTLNYLSLPAVAKGLEFVKPLLTTLSWRVQTLVEYLWRTLPGVQYDDAHATSLIEIRGPPPSPDRGSTLALIFHAPGDLSGAALAPYKFIVWAAARQKISVRGGPCLCNPGASKSIMRGIGFDTWDKTNLSESGIIRISLGIASNFEDCLKFVQFCKQLSAVSFYQKEYGIWLAEGQMVL